MFRGKDSMKHSVFTLLLLLLILTGTALAAELPEVDPAEFVGKKIGVVSGSVQEKWASDDFGSSQLVYFSSFQDGMMALENGMIDAIYSSDLPLRYALGTKKGLEILLVGDGSVPVSVIFGQNEAGDKLREQFNSYLAKIKADGIYEKFERKWIDGPEEKRVFGDPSLPPSVNGKLDIITQSGAAPFDYMKNGEMHGLEVEIVREFCRTYGYEPVFHDATLDAAIMGVHTGKYDMGSCAFMITEERAKSVRFGDPILSCHGALFVKEGTFQGTRRESASRAQADMPIAVLSEFDGKRIGVQSGSIEETRVSDTFRDPEITYYSSFSDAIIALQTDRIDAFFAEDLVLRYVSGAAEGLTVLEAGGDGFFLSPVFPKTERGDLLRGQYNTFLAEFKQSGRLEELAKKWIDGPEENRVMDTTPLPGPNGVISIATEVGYAPHEYLKNGEIVGFEAELLREFCQAYGYRPEYYNTAFDSIIMGVYTGKFDMGASAFAATEERKKSVNFGDPFYTVHDGLLVRKDGGWTGISGQNSGSAGKQEKETGTEREKQTFFEAVASGLHRTFVEEGRWKLFISGIWLTFLITALSVLFGTTAGFGLYLLCRNGNKAANALVKAVNWFITGMPLVVFLMVLFYVVFARSGLSGTVVAIIGFTIVFALTVFHLLQSGEGAVSIGQKEAAYALGYSDLDAFLRIILPQAAMHFLPSYQSEIISLLKATAVVGYITVMDVTKIGDVIRGRTYDAVYPLFAVVVSYFLLSAVCKAAVRFLMRKVNTKNRPKSDILKGVEIE